MRAVGYFSFLKLGHRQTLRLSRCPIECILQDQQTNSSITQTHMFQSRKNYKETKHKKMKLIFNEILIGANKHDILFCLLNTDRV